jgi:PTH1 family peptidyl-tRNA hydrolase
MESIIQNLRTEEIARLRCGVAPVGTEVPGDELVEFVLAPFDKSEEERVVELIDEATDACELWWSQGSQPTMNRYNG